jgi:hypothetical protein
MNEETMLITILSITLRTLILFSALWVLVCGILAIYWFIRSLKKSEYKRKVKSLFKKAVYGIIIAIVLYVIAGIIGKILFPEPHIRWDPPIYSPR